MPTLSPWTAQQQSPELALAQSPWPPQQQQMFGASPLPTGSPVPTTTRHGLQVAQDDCDVTIRSDGISSPAPPSRTTGSRIFVQQGRDNSNFRALPASRVRRSAGGAGGAQRFGGSASPGLRSGGPELADERGGLGELRNTSSVSASSDGGARIDPDAVFLQRSSATDREIGELLVRRAQCEANASVLFFWCQALLVGVGLAAASMVVGSEGDALRHALAIFHPGLGRIVMILGEVAVVGSVWQFADSLASSVGDNRAAAAGDFLNFSVDSSPMNDLSATYSASSDKVGGNLGGDREGQSPLFRQRMLSGFRLAFNLALLLCCLAGSGRADVVLHYGPWPNGGDWPSNLARSAISAWLPLSVAALVLTPWPRPTVSESPLLFVSGGARDGVRDATPSSLGASAALGQTAASLASPRRAAAGAASRPRG